MISIGMLRIELNPLVMAAVFLVLAPVVGGLLNGIERKIAARVQGRKGPSLLAPFAELRRLFDKEQITPGAGQEFFAWFALLVMAGTGAVLFAGVNLILTVCLMGTATVLLVLASYVSGSPFARLGAERALMRLLAGVPMVLLLAILLGSVAGSYNAIDIAQQELIFPLFGAFVGYVVVLVVLLGKSPFDLHMTSHPYHELAGGVAEEFSGRTLILIRLYLWYKDLYLLGIVFLFFGAGTLRGILTGVGVCLGVFLLVGAMGSSFARLKWQNMIRLCWGVTAVFGGGNLLYMYFLMYVGLL